MTWSFILGILAFSLGWSVLFIEGPFLSGLALGGCSLALAGLAWHLGAPLIAFFWAFLGVAVALSYREPALLPKVVPKSRVHLWALVLLGLVALLSLGGLWVGYPPADAIEGDLVVRGDWLLYLYTKGFPEVGGVALLALVIFLKVRRVKRRH